MNIDCSYFTKGRRAIFNATSLGAKETKPNSYAVNMLILDYIDQYSPIFLNRILGGEIAEKMLADNGSNEYLTRIFDDIKEAMADYVMFNILRYCGQRLTADGVVNLKSVNTLISPAVYQANIWNDMVDKMRIFCVKFPEIRVDNCFLRKITSCWI